MSISISDKSVTIDEFLIEKNENKTFWKQTIKKNMDEYNLGMKVLFPLVSSTQEGEQLLNYSTAII